MYLVDKGGGNYFEEGVVPNRLLAIDPYDSFALKRGDYELTLKKSEFQTIDPNRLNYIGSTVVGIHSRPGIHALRIYGNMGARVRYWRMKEMIKLRLTRLQLTINRKLRLI